MRILLPQTHVVRRPASSPGKYQRLRSEIDPNSNDQSGRAAVLAQLARISLFAWNS